MNQNKKIKIYYGLGFLAILIVFFWYLGGISPQDENNSLAVTVLGKTPDSSPKQAAFEQNIPSKQEVETANSTEIQKISVKLVAGENSYKFAVPEGTNIYEAMEILTSTTDFKFTDKYYSSLGYLIESINGAKNSGGTYWTLYINGKYSNVGASSYRLKDGDLVKWKYEKN